MTVIISYLPGCLLKASAVQLLSKTANQYQNAGDVERISRYMKPTYDIR
jgi:hypothetical protein